MSYFSETMTVNTSRGAVTLQAWSAVVIEGRWLDIMFISDILGPIRDERQLVRRKDAEKGVWDAFWRLLRLSLPVGEELPSGLNWADRQLLIDALWELNDLDEATKKRLSSSQRASERASRMMTLLELNQTKNEKRKASASISS